jgi:putative redox protein
MMTVHWQGGLAFAADTPTGHRIVVDALTDAGNPEHGPTPIETFLCALAACSAMDVMTILEKKRQKVDSYRVEVGGERPPAGEWPRPFTKMVIRHVLSGDLDPAAVERAVQLTDEKYCSILATLRAGPEVTSEFAIEPETRPSASEA